MDAPTLSVHELNSIAQAALREAFPSEVWVRGEVQKCRVMGSGHTYFSLVEKASTRDGVQATIDCVLWAGNARRIANALRETPGGKLTEGTEVRIRGRLDVYPVTGRMQFVMSRIDPLFTVGAMAQRREQVMRALSADGLLDRNAAIRLPMLPLRVALITSVDSAAYADFVHELTAAPFAWRLRVVDTLVQGRSASRSIARAISSAEHHAPDVIVLVRGGGAQTDLAAFDSDVVGRAIARCSIPVFTGIGHETDRSVADEVAHSSFKTPTACAQELVAIVRAVAARNEQVWARIRQLAVTHLDRSDAALENHGRLVRRSVLVHLAREEGRVGEGHRRLRRAALEAPNRAQSRLERRSGRVREVGRSRLQAESVHLEHTYARLARVPARLGPLLDRLDHQEAQVRALDPRRILARGYSLTRGEDGALVRAAGDAPPGSRLVTELAEGVVTSRVESHTEAGVDDPAPQEQQR
ncbi:MAG: xseA [Actinomycetia bacterium]|nr:xseA [Actinomycetes bacterium]